MIISIKGANAFMKQSMESVVLAGLIAVVIGIVQVLKASGLPTQYAPLASLAIGLSFSLFFTPFSQEAVVNGLILGLASCGFWSGTRTTANL